MTCSQTSNKTQPLGNPADFSLLLLDRRGFFFGGRMKKLLSAKTSDGDSVMLLLVAFVIFATLFSVACHAAEIQQYFGICP